MFGEHGGRRGRFARRRLRSVSGEIFEEGGERLTFSDVHSVPCESGSFPDQGTLLRKKLWHFSAHELVANWLVTIWI